MKLCGICSEIGYYWLISRLGDDMAKEMMNRDKTTNNQTRKDLQRKKKQQFC